ncbi:hypothetical protein CMI44_02225 [Candidatus Pacearchaeota archaeon]|nr:hypothetical protein [Candidatus Pacearchaeota archaeon]
MKWKRLLPIIGIAIFVYILFRLDVSKILLEVKNANSNLLITALFFFLIFMVLQTGKWFVIARVQKIDISYIDAFKINTKTFFYSFITPSRIGVAMRAEYLRRHNGNLGKGLSNYTIDKVLDLCALIFIVIFAIAIKAIIPRVYIYYFSIALILLIVGLILFIEEKRSRKILGIFLKRIVPKRMKNRGKKLFESFYENMPKKRYFPLFFLMNLLTWIVLETVNYFIGLSLGINVSYFYYLAILPLATLISQIPITIGGLGTREASLIGFFSLLNVEATKVFSMSMIGLALTAILPAIIGGFLILKSKKKFDRKFFNS